MADLLLELAAQDRSLSEELYGRPGHLKIFVSSKMAGSVYVVERRSCADAVDGTGMARAWYWERDASAGPYCSEGICLHHAATADGLILILGDELTPITRREYEVARAREVPTFVFVDQRQTRSPDATRFLNDVRTDSVTKNFENVAELQTHAVDALRSFMVYGWRHTSYSRWERGRKGRPT